MPPIGGKHHRGPGRPCLYAISPTVWGRWIDERGISVSGFIATMRASAEALGYPADVVPSHTHMRCVKNKTRLPSALTMLIIRHATGGDIDLQHWAVTPDEVRRALWEQLAGRPRWSGREEP